MRGDSAAVFWKYELTRFLRVPGLWSEDYGYSVYCRFKGIVDVRLEAPANKSYIRVKIECHQDTD